MNLTRDNYFSQEASRQYMGSTQFKNFAPAFGGCEAAAMAKLSGEYEEPENPAFVVGHYMHSWAEGKLEEFKANHPELYSSRGKTAGQLKAEFQHCNTMIEVLESDPMVAKALEGDKEVILTAELFGVPWKIMIDSYNPDKGFFTDLKSLKSIDGKWWNKDAGCYENFLDHWGYTLQMAIYAEIEKRATGRDKWLIPHMVIVTKEDPPDHEIIYFDYEAIETSLVLLGHHIERVIDVKAGKVEPVRCEKCVYCRKTKKIKAIKHYKEFDLY